MGLLESLTKMIRPVERLCGKTASCGKKGGCVG